MKYYMARKILLPFVALAVFGAAGCAGGSLTTREKGAGIGALGGAAAGGIIGSAVGHPGAESGNRRCSRPRRRCARRRPTTGAEQSKLRPGRTDPKIKARSTAAHRARALAA